MRAIRYAALALALSCMPLTAGEDHDAGTDDHLSEVAGLRILHAWTNATTADTARVYMEIENGSGGEIVLVGGTASIGAGVALMGAPIRAGETAPLPIPPFPIAPGTDMALEPATLFLLIDGLTRPLSQGDDFDMHVTIEPLGEIAIHVTVEAADAKQHSHAGHSH